jgi:hypothetical protein
MITFRLPPPIMSGSTAQFSMGELVHRHTRQADYADVYDPSDPAEWLLGRRLPPFQRPAVWSVPQSIRFIESAWLGVHLGTYVVNRCDEFVGDYVHRTDGWIIDGQQRLRAVQGYITDAFPVFGLLYGDLNQVETRRFASIPFAASVITEKDEGKLRVLYDILNFGGTAHTEDQRAS